MCFVLVLQDVPAQRLIQLLISKKNCFKIKSIASSPVLQIGWCLMEGKTGFQYLQY